MTIITSGNSMNWESGTNDYCDCDWPSGRPSTSCYSSSLGSFSKCNYCEKYLKCEMCDDEQLAILVYKNCVVCKEHMHMLQVRIWG